MMKSMTSMGVKNMGCWDGVCPKCHAGKKLILGVLVLLNAWFNVVSWAVFIGVILVLMGLLKWIKPTCPHCQ